jgi:hypothetical protein
MSIHTCHLHCHSIDPEKMELMGLEDKGKWMPFSFHMDIVIACKLTSEDDESLTNCTTLFTEQGDAYIIDTPFTEFQQMFISYHNADAPAPSSKDLNF